MADSRGQSTKLPTDSQKKLQQSQAQVDEVSIIIYLFLLACIIPMCTV